MKILKYSTTFDVDKLIADKAILFLKQEPDVLDASYTGNSLRNFEVQVPDNSTPSRCFQLGVLLGNILCTVFRI